MSPPPGGPNSNLPPVYHFFGTITISPGTVLTAIIGLLFVLPVLVNLLPWRDDLVRWLPSSAARAISATVWNSGPQNAHLFSPWGQFAVFAVCTTVLLVVGGILFRKRDV